MPNPYMVASMPDIVIIRTGGEIGIKSKPVRSSYERLILKSIKTRMKAESIPYEKIWRIAGRIYVECEDAGTVARTLSRLFGVSSTSPGMSMPSDLETIVEKGVALAEKAFKPGKFAVRCRRVGEHGFSSQDICRILGKAVLSSGIKLKVDLERPDQVLNIEIRDDMAVIYSECIRGPDGFPLGAQGPLLGVIDGTPGSLLACWSMMKRGSDLRAVSPASEDGGFSLDPFAEKHLRLLAAWKPGGGMRVAAFPVPKGLSLDERDAYLLSAATSLADKRGIEAVVSGLSPSLGSMALLKALPVYVLFPMVAIDKGLADAWASIIGLEYEVSLSDGTELSGSWLSGQPKPPAKPSLELTVKA
jgi:thiamine biosynthesis protein ThiI